MCCNKIAPAYEGRELGIGDALLFKALAESCGSTVPVIKGKFKEAGDLGVVAEQCRGTQKTLMKPKPLTARGVFEKFVAISREQGNKVELPPPILSLEMITKIVVC